VRTYIIQNQTKFFPNNSCYVCSFRPRGRSSHDVMSRSYFPGYDRCVETHQCGGFGNGICPPRVYTCPTRVPEIRDRVTLFGGDSTGRARECLYADTRARANVCAQSVVSGAACCFTFRTPRDWPRPTKHARAAARDNGERGFSGRKNKHCRVRPRPVRKRGLDAFPFVFSLMLLLN